MHLWPWGSRTDEHGARRVLGEDPVELGRVDG
jgi:hypothetical protein